MTRRDTPSRTFYCEAAAVNLRHGMCPEQCRECQQEEFMSEPKEMDFFDYYAPEMK